MKTPTSEDAHLEVDGPQLRHVLSTIKKMGKRSVGSEVLVTFADEEVIFTLPGMTLAANAQGTWRGQARIPLSGFALFTSILPKKPVVRVTVQDGRFSLDGASVPCVWAPQNVAIPLPLNPTKADLACLPYHFTDDEIRDAGLTDAVTKVQAEQEKALAAASATLAPFGVTEHQLRDLIEQALMERGLPCPPTVRHAELLQRLSDLERTAYRIQPGSSAASHS